MLICCVFTPEQARTEGADSALGAAAPSLAVAALCGAAVYKNVSCSLVAFVFSAVVDILIKIINVSPQKGHNSTRKHPRASKGPLKEGDPQDLPGPAVKKCDSAYRNRDDSLVALYSLL